jgi:hypothetical protein
MLKADTKEKIKAFGFDVDKLIEAIKAEAEVDYAIPDDVTVLKNSDLEARDLNNKTAGKTEGITEGEKKGKELAAKAFKRKLSISDTVPNEIDKVIEAANEQLGRGDQGLKEQIDLLQKDKERLETEKKDLQGRAEQAAFDSELISYFPSNRTTDLTDGERLALVKMNMSFETLDGKTVVKRNGEIVRDKNSQSPLAIKDVVASLFTEKKWNGGDPGAGGRGGGDNPPGGNGAGLKKISAFREKWTAENPGKDSNGPEFQEAIGKHAKDMKDFDWYN